MQILERVFFLESHRLGNVFLVQEDGKFGMVNLPWSDLNDVPESIEDKDIEAVKGTVITPPKWDEIRANICIDPGDMPESEAAYEMDRITCDYYVRNGAHWGILDEAGHMIQEPQYDDVIIVNYYESIGVIESTLRHGFSIFDLAGINGRVVVRRENKWGMLKAHGREVLPVIYDSITIVCYHWPSGNVYTVCKDGLCGVVDRDGKCMIPLVYPSLSCYGLDYLWDTTVFEIDDDGKKGYVRLGDGKCLVDAEWDRVDMHRLNLLPDDEPYGYIFIVWKSEKCGVIFHDEGVIISPVWDEIIPQRFPLRDPVSYSVRKGNLWGCCDEKGKLICDAEWDEVGMYLNGVVCVKKDGKWGAIDSEGKLCVPTEWDAIEGFGMKQREFESTAATNVGVLLGLNKDNRKHLSKDYSWVCRDGLWGIIDRSGNVILEPTYERFKGQKKDE